MAFLIYRPARILAAVMDIYECSHSPWFPHKLPWLPLFTPSSPYPPRTATDSNNSRSSLFLTPSMIQKPRDKPFLHNNSFQNQNNSTHLRSIMDVHSPYRKQGKRKKFHHQRKVQFEIKSSFQTEKSTTAYRVLNKNHHA